MKIYVGRDVVILLLGCRHWLALATPPDRTTEDWVRTQLAGTPDLPNTIFCTACRTYRRPALDELDDFPMVLGGWELVRL